MTSPISSVARDYVRSRATAVMECTCQIERSGRPEGYDETSLIHTSAEDPEIVYTGVCRIWELSSSSSIVVGGTDVYQQSTNLSIPWDTPVVIRRYDVVTILTAPQDPQIVGKRYEIASVAKAGELRATRRFEVVGLS